ncbi:hypothetical protein MPNT_50102 [Candidatus Methylacidithermus pantelleriae]|uniref:Uncharacterized protein n=1 Tax=Candidatus Methylacidithermus pantelleriae TaxID=2744239 RepID=A0A8J2BMM4_9BACT|nr:hypothetical protein MPNT_50102 [Candidatus Methylacidithermus pantelleriae]
MGLFAVPPFAGVREKVASLARRSLRREEFLERLPLIAPPFFTFFVRRPGPVPFATCPW